ncbi:MAG: PRC-barrel domain-containing protein [bacterium]|nr:PRC-barrel domain-containing protein [bacterium]
MREIVLTGVAIGAALACVAPLTHAQEQTKKPAVFVLAQTSDQWLATKLKGTDVLGSDNQKIGDVSDILLDKSGRVIAYVVNLGGFLGLGAKDVGLAIESFEVVSTTGSYDKLKLNASKNELTQAAGFQRCEASREKKC